MYVVDLKQIVYNVIKTLNNFATSFSLSVQSKLFAKFSLVSSSPEKFKANNL